ncbi:hypothetical protein GCM10025865_20000 [Paraoerskovia sediminicola]|uniref:beta-N-acetylhexosaminidase n=1 Tax=Paraoerskovia sediminicola TaxID=1138587 RepID=A0ABN6XCU9_9CELL|nr:family 20 glycosylhydrolase [Paraoerskovia sediminicola]BDZ42701.1 hypothetical protein GCM10025865_20000 [Paraoerskovia sediminicola]
MVDGLPADAIEGVEAAVWTETIDTEAKLYEMLLPRLAAVAEVAWTDPARKDWSGFRARIASVASAWDRDGLPFYRSPQVDW